MTKSLPLFPLELCDGDLEPVFCFHSASSLRFPTVSVTLQRRNPPAHATALRCVNNGSGEDKKRLHYPYTFVVIRRDYIIITLL